MKLIHFQGLNCYLNCMISAAAYRGANYEHALATLWSETDFIYDHSHQVYSSKRLFSNLEAMGIKRQILGCVSEPEKEEHLSRFQKGELFIVGMDAFYVPWSPIYQALHDLHYFLAQKWKEELFFCSDPTYGKKYVRITKEDIILHAFGICRMEKAAENPFCIGVAREAEEVLRSHPQMLETLLLKINACTGQKHKNAGPLGKYADTLMNNRYLYKHYLQASDLDQYQSLFDPEFFSRWKAVKHGLYKASFIEKNEKLIHEVGKRLRDIIQEEITLAQQIAAKAGPA